MRHAGIQRQIQPRSPTMPQPTWAKMGQRHPAPYPDQALRRNKDLVITLTDAPPTVRGHRKTHRQAPPAQRNDSRRSQTEEHSRGPMPLSPAAMTMLENRYYDHQANAGKLFSPTAQNRDNNPGKLELPPLLRPRRTYISWPPLLLDQGPPLRMTLKLKEVGKTNTQLVIPQQERSWSN